MYGPAVGWPWWCSAGLSQTVQIPLMPPILASVATSMATPAINWMTNWPSSVRASAHRPPTVQ